MNCILVAGSKGTRSDENSGARSSYLFTNEDTKIIRDG